MADQITGLLSPWLRKQRLAQARPYLRGKILDYGCGTGELTMFCEPQHYVGFDRDLPSLEKARQLHPKFRFTNQGPRHATFDTICLLAVIEHVKNPHELLVQLHALLEPMGHIVLTTPHPHFDWLHTLGANIGLFSSQARDEHEQLFDRKMMSELLQKTGFKLTQTRYFLCGANQLFVLEKSAVTDQARCQDFIDISLKAGNK